MCIQLDCSLKNKVKDIRACIQHHWSILWQSARINKIWLEIEHTSLWWISALCIMITEQRPDHGLHLGRTKSRMKSSYISALIPPLYTLHAMYHSQTRLKVSWDYQLSVRWLYIEFCCLFCIAMHWLAKFCIDTRFIDKNKLVSPPVLQLLELGSTEHWVMFFRLFWKLLLVK